MHLVSEIILPGSSAPAEDHHTVVALSALMPHHAAQFHQSARYVCPVSAPANNTVSSSALKLVWRSKIGTSRRGGPFDQNFGFNSAFRHHRLHPVNIQRTWRQMVDMASRENRPHQQSTDVRCARRDRFLHLPLLTGASETFPGLPAQTPVPVFR